MNREKVFEYQGVCAPESSWKYSGWTDYQIAEYTKFVCWITPKPLGYSNIYVKDEPVNKYHRQLKGVTVDVYDVLKAFNVTCPATQHALKKMLCTGLRGHKDAETDLNEAIASLQRAKELLGDE